MPDMNAELEMIKKVQQQNELKSQLKAKAKTDVDSLKSDIAKSTKLTAATKTIAQTYLTLFSSFEGKSLDALVDRLNQNAQKTLQVKHDRKAFINSIRTK
ncbi:hypothetical protein BSA171_16930 [Bacillus safensis]|uniref:hypothetical protein n=1 Tax=Bacillus safensis TaxID=561879 RepID=UPI00094BE273|nr:hypothetical protein [Bacillus safensis]APT48566.1 hypothetical protein BSA41_00785 [Bacillus safensis]APT55158.1 hypothetical protein BSA171_16930 [Bacillus safensis]